MSTTTINWNQSEWSDDAFEADVNGITAVVETGGSDGFWWYVRPSGSRSEAPEMYASGTSTTMEEAIEFATAHAIEADKKYPI